MREGVAASGRKDVRSTQHDPADTRQLPRRHCTFPLKIGPHKTCCGQRRQSQSLTQLMTRQESFPRSRLLPLAFGPTISHRIVQRSSSAIRVSPTDHRRHEHSDQDLTTNPNAAPTGPILPRPPCPCQQDFLYCYNGPPGSCWKYPRSITYSCNGYLTPHSDQCVAVFSDPSDRPS